MRTDVGRLAGSSVHDLLNEITVKNLKNGNYQRGDLSVHLSYARRLWFAERGNFEGDSPAGGSSRAKRNS